MYSTAHGTLDLGEFSNRLKNVFTKEGEEEEEEEVPNEAERFSPVDSVRKKALTGFSRPRIVTNNL